MPALKLKAHVGHDGILRLNVPMGVADVDGEVVVTVPPSMTAEEWHAFVDRSARAAAMIKHHRLDTPDADT